MDSAPTKVRGLAVCSNTLYGNEPRQMQKDFAGCVGEKGGIEMKNSRIILDGFKLETHSPNRVVAPEIAMRFPGPSHSGEIADSKCRV